MITKLVLNQKETVSAEATRANFGLQGALVLELGGKEIGRVPVYTPENLPPEQSAYMKKYSPTLAQSYPANNWFQALGSALKALFEMGASSK